MLFSDLQWGPQHGYGIVEALRCDPETWLQVETGSLYPALHRLERQSWVQSEWKQSESKQKAPILPNHGQGEKAVGL